MSNNPFFFGDFSQMNQFFFDSVQQYRENFEKIIKASSQPNLESILTDRRFKDEAWKKNPYFFFVHQFYLLQCQYFEAFAEKIGFLDKKQNFFLKLWLESLSPANFPFTNPKVMERVAETGGKNLSDGFQSFLQNHVSKKRLLPRLTDENAFVVGKDLATTPGDVIFENEIFQLVEYTPAQKKIHETPLLIIPPWINKFYIFDLTKEKSFIDWNLKKGRKVYVVSWVNASQETSHLTFEDFVLRGAKKAMEVVEEKYGLANFHTVGFCVGGVALACLLNCARENIRTATFLATPFDFSKLDEISMFFSKTEMSFLKYSLGKDGVMSGEKMSLMFRALRSSDLIWQNYISHYLMGEPLPAHDFLFWNDDSTNLPGKMHLEYLETFFVENAFMTLNPKKIGCISTNLHNIETPTMIVATKKDHIVPWGSSFMGMQFFKNSEFILGESGHIAGIINHPDQKKYSYFVNEEKRVLDTEAWLKYAKEKEGSWWVRWQMWISSHEKKKIDNYTPKDVIEKAPGRYIFAS